MRVIKKELMHPRLRLIGTAARFLMPYYTPAKFRWANKMSARLFNGRWQGRHTECEFLNLSRPDGTFMRTLVITGRERRENAPALLWLHGGGYAIGSPEMDFLFIERFISEGAGVVVAPDYRLSLEKPYPAAVDDAYLALEWMRNHAADYSARSDQLFVGGDSAGGGLTAAVCLLARDRGEISVAFHMPLYPMLDDRMATPAARENDAPVWNAKSNECAWRLYLGDLYGQKDVPIYAAPARCRDLSGMPPAATFVGGIDMFMDETVSYINLLKEAGVEARIRIFPGCFHGFDIVGLNTDVAKGAIEFISTEFVYAANKFFSPQPLKK